MAVDLFKNTPEEADDRPVEPVRALDTDDRVQVWDDRVGLVFEYFKEEGRAVVHVPAGDLKIVADQGAVELEAKKGIRIRSMDDVEVVSRNGILMATSGEKPGQASAFSLAKDGLQMIGQAVGIKAEAGLFQVGRLSMSGKKLKSTFDSAVSVFDRFEQKADTVTETARFCYQSAQELMVTKAGQWRQKVETLFTLQTDQATIKADDDVMIEGREIRLG